MDLFPRYRKWRLNMAPGYEQVWHIKDYPYICDAFDPTPQGSVPGYCWGDYQITESGVLQFADCTIKTGSPLITYGIYSLSVMAWLRTWYIRAEDEGREMERV